MKIITRTLFCLTLFFYTLSIFALANPAAINCSKHKLKYVSIQNTGICIFLDGSYCEEWAYFRGTCQKGQNLFPGGNFDKTKVKQYCITRVNNIPLVEMCRGATK